MKKSKGNRNHGTIYYIVFFTLLVALVTFAVLAICLGNLPLLFTAIGIALLFLAFTLAMRVYTKKRVAAVEKRLKEDGKALLESDIPRTVYLVYFGPLSRAKKPKVKNPVFYVEFYETVDAESLKRHLYYGLSPEGENELAKSRLGSVVCSIEDVLSISGKRVFLQDDFYQEAIASLTYTAFFERNQIVVFGKSEEKQKSERKEKKKDKKRPKRG